jgi:magnesium-transporting ATPase (P-type)
MHFTYCFSRFFQFISLLDVHNLILFFVLVPFLSWQASKRQGRQRCQTCVNCPSFSPEGQHTQLEEKVVKLKLWIAYAIHFCHVSTKRSEPFCFRWKKKWSWWCCSLLSCILLSMCDFSSFLALPGFITSPLFSLLIMVEKVHIMVLMPHYTILQQMLMPIF